MIEITRHGLGYGYGGCGMHEHRMTHDELHFPGLTQTEIRKRKNDMLLDSVINKTGRRSGQKVKRFGRG